MHNIIVKQGFAVIVAFSYICLFKNPVLWFWKLLVVKIVCKKTSYHYGGGGGGGGAGGKAPAAGQFLQFFQK